MARFSTHVFEGQIITFAWPHCYPIIVDRYGAGWRQMKRGSATVSTFYLLERGYRNRLVTAHHFMQEGKHKMAIYCIIAKFNKTGNVDRKRGSGGQNAVSTF